MIIDKRKFRYKIILIVLAGISFVLWRLLGTVCGINGYLNLDDLSSVQFAMIGNGFVEKIKGILAEDPTNVPIFYLLLYVWIKLFGYSANTMRILPQLCGALLVFFVGLIVEKIGNEKMGILAAVLAGTSVQLVYVSYQIRAYSMLMMFSAILFYVFLNRRTQWKSIILYALSLLLLSYTHFFGVLVCAGLGSLDIINIILKKREKKYLISYVIYVFLFVPYLATAYIKAAGMWAVFWPPVPAYRDIFFMIGDMCPGTVGKWSIYVFGGVFFVYLVSAVNAIKKKDNNFIQSEIFTCFWVVFAVLTVGFVYSRYINPQSSVWVYRYFLVLFPFMVTVISYGLWNILDFVQNKTEVSKAVFIGILLFLGCRYTYTNLEYEMDHAEEIVLGSSDFEKLTGYIMSSDEIKEENTLVYFEYPDRYFAGWKEYASQGGKKKLPNLCNTKDRFMETDLLAYDAIYVVDIVYELTDEEKGHLGETHQLVEENCAGSYHVDKYERY